MSQDSQVLFLLLVPPADWRPHCQLSGWGVIMPTRDIQSQCGSLRWCVGGDTKAKEGSFAEFPWAPGEVLTSAWWWRELETICHTLCHSFSRVSRLWIPLPCPGSPIPSLLSLLVQLTCSSTPSFPGLSCQQ